MKISTSMKGLPERAAENRRKRKKRLRLIAQAKAGELEAERSVMVDYFDRMPMNQLRAVYKAAQLQFGKGRQRPGGELAGVIEAVTGGGVC